MEAETTAQFINGELYKDGGFFDKAWNMVDQNRDGTLSRAEFGQTLAFLSVIAKQDEYLDNLDTEAIWLAATESGDLTKTKLGEGIRDMFGDGLKSLLLKF